MKFLAAVVFSLSASAIQHVQTPSRDPNMNGAYFLSATPKAKNTSAFPTNYRDYPGGVEYFDVYSPPISTLYSQVFWTRLPDVDLPAEIVKRFDGKGMAVVGFELDQVRIGPNGEDIPVPINVAYNHHFESTMLGKNSWVEKIKVQGPSDPRIPPNMGHGRPDPEFAYVVHQQKSDSGLSASQNFGAANGGEVRKSFHGWAPGQAKVIESPQKLSITPMQIDTWNRDSMNVTGGPFVPGPVPRNSLAPITGPDAIYSGLLECPVTTRIRKNVDGAYSILLSGDHCQDAISSAEECFAAVPKLGFSNATTFTESTETSSDLPVGCSASVDHAKSTVSIIFNKAAATGVACGEGSTLFTGTTASLVKVEVSLDRPKLLATITLTGPSDVWYGVGFGASAMADTPWTIVVDGTGTVSERKLANHDAGTALPASVKVVSNHVDAKLRTVVLTRPFAGKSSDYYTFDPEKDSVLHFINAVGSTADFQYHKDRTAAQLLILPDQKSVCVCASNPAPFGQAKGSLQYEDTVVGFGNNCAPQPRTDLLAQKNPTCDVRTYSGGQLACHHMWSLLDADQEIPWKDQPIEYHLKFRFWFQEYNSSYHQDIYRTTWGIASPVEYDVPQCAKGTPTEQCVHTITGLFDVPAPKGDKQMKLAAAHFHCHAPTCLMVELWNNKTGELLCREKPIYGNTGVIPEPRFDEPGFILQPPCLWGSPEQGLDSPPLVGGQTLYARKHSNSTYGHHGEMAWLQVHYILE
eukprot:CAMPEP_0175139606 /NCGR_PEP_ID=MMETSP0087-20121206/11003_1 /TAXON_ID=136419 /ORGANISM="Unknown Unknown, Strain D1" /LENGTH=748 /DNA_ID=CAMNT_0016422649 /DNA_START=31 /DNA_END=2277 /DNA_ORIENTATION=-